MGGIGDLLGAFIDKEAIVQETIQGTLENVAKELACDQKGLFIMIKPINEEYEFKCYIYQVVEGASPKFVREITLAEILGEKNGK